MYMKLSQQFSTRTFWSHKDTTTYMKKLHIWENEATCEMIHQTMQVLSTKQAQHTCEIQLYTTSEVNCTNHEMKSQWTS